MTQKLTTFDDDDDDREVFIPIKLMKDKQIHKYFSNKKKKLAITKHLINKIDNKSFWPLEETMKRDDIKDIFLYKKEMSNRTYEKINFLKE